MNATRPIRSGPRKTKIVTLRMTADEYKRLSEAAWRYRISMNMFAISAIMGQAPAVNGHHGDTEGSVETQSPIPNP